MPVQSTSISPEQHLANIEAMRTHQPLPFGVARGLRLKHEYTCVPEPAMTERELSADTILNYFTADPVTLPVETLKPIRPATMGKKVAFDSVLARELADTNYREKEREYLSKKSHIMNGRKKVTIIGKKQQQEYTEKSKKGSLPKQVKPIAQTVDLKFLFNRIDEVNNMKKGKQSFEEVCSEVTTKWISKRIEAKVYKDQLDEYKNGMNNRKPELVETSFNKMADDHHSINVGVASSDKQPKGQEIVMEVLDKKKECPVCQPCTKTKYTTEYINDLFSIPVKNFL